LFKGLTIKLAIPEDTDYEKLKKSELIQLLKNADELNAFRGKLIQMYENNFEFAKGELLYLNSVVDANDKINFLRDMEVHKKGVELKELQFINNKRRKFFSDISYEFRNLLSLSMIPLEALLDGETGPITNQQKQVLNLVYNSSKKAISFVNDLLELANLDTKKVKLLIQKNALSGIVNNLVNLFVDSASRKGVFFDIRLPEKQTDVWIDSQKIESIIITFLSNSVKYAENQTKITVELKEQKQFVVISITFTPLSEYEFDPKDIFEKAGQESSTKEKSQINFGVGIALCKELIELHKGQIGVKKTAKKRLRMFIKIRKGYNHYPKEILKLGWGELERRSAKRILEELETKTGTGVTSLNYEIDNFYTLSNNELKELQSQHHKDSLSRIKKNIIVIESNIELLKFLEYILGPQYNVKIFTSCQVAYNYLHDNTADLIIADVSPGKVSGLDLCTLVKSDPRTSSIQVVLVSAEAEKFIPGLKIGADDFLLKPFNLNEFMVRIHNLLKRKHFSDLVVDQYRQMEKELILARKIQEGLLPRGFPQTGEYNFQTYYEPVDIVGGDFYDFVDYKNEIGILITDVSGHGVAAAFVASMVKMIFATAAINFRSAL
jgi:two-component system sensor histidine kinase ChiS